VDRGRRRERLEQWQRDVDTYKREINLVEYAISRGYELRKKECYRSARVLKHPADQHKIVVSRDATDGHWVYFGIQPGYEGSQGRGLARTADNGTIVDFILHRAGGRLDMKQVHAECRRWLGRPDPLPPNPTYDVEASLPAVRDRLACALRYQDAQVAETSPYLLGRGLSAETLRHPRFRDTWRQDARGNVLFVHRDREGISGFEVKNHGFTGFAAGGTKTCWHSAAYRSDAALVVAESAIDALSYHELHARADARYVSTAGMPSALQLGLLERAAAKMASGSTIIAAVDADRGGDLLSHVLKRCMAQSHVRFVRHSPTQARAKDWNDVLRMQRQQREQTP